MLSLTAVNLEVFPWSQGFYKVMFLAHSCSSFSSPSRIRTKWLPYSPICWLLSIIRTISYVTQAINLQADLDGLLNRWLIGYRNCIPPHVKFSASLKTGTNTTKIIASPCILTHLKRSNFKVYWSHVPQKKSLKYHIDNVVKNPNSTRAFIHRNLRGCPYDPTAI